VVRNACGHASFFRFSRVLALCANLQKTREFVVFLGKRLHFGKSLRRYAKKTARSTPIDTVKLELRYE